MGEKVTFDPVNKIIQVTQVPVDGVVTINVKTDIYSDGKEDWKTDPNLIKYTFPLRSVGGDPLPGEKALGSTYFLSLPWRIKPYGASHTLRVNGNFYMEDGSSAFISPDGAYTVTIESTVSNLVDSQVAQLPEIEHASYQNHVWVDATSSNSGTEYPVGTRRIPVNNMIDAISIAKERGFGAIGLLSQVTIGAGVDLRGLMVVGFGGQESDIQTIVIIGSEAQTHNCEFYYCYVTGEIGGRNYMNTCTFGNLSGMDGLCLNCVVLGDVQIGSGGRLTLAECMSINNPDRNVFDMGGSGQTLILSQFSGHIVLANKTGPEIATLGFATGSVEIASTVENGEINIQGNVGIIDNSTGTAIVDRHTVTVPDVVYNDGIWIDNVNGIESSEYPTGISSRPVKGNDNAIALANRYSITVFNVIGTITVDRDFIGVRVIGDISLTNSLIVFNSPGYNYRDSRFERLTITGILSTESTNQQYENCIIQDLTNVQGLITESAIGGTISVNGDLFMRNISTTGHPVIIDISVAPASSYRWDMDSAHIQIEGMTADSLIALTIRNGELIIGVSCTGGTIHVHGNVIITDNSGGAVIIEDFTNTTDTADAVFSRLENSHNASLLSRKIQTNKAVISEDRRRVTIFDDDGITALIEFDISEDQLQRIPI